jgi:hypothetical protein
MFLMMSLVMRVNALHRKTLASKLIFLRKIIGLQFKLGTEACLGHETSFWSLQPTYVKSNRQLLVLGQESIR